MLNIFKKNKKYAFSDVEYNVEFPPMGVDYDSWNNKTAKEYFEWYISQIPLRTEYLCNRVSSDLKIDISLLDFSPESLNIIWEWYLKTAIIKKCDTKETEKQKETELYRLVGESSINYEELSLNSLLIQRDIGMYLAEVFLTECKALSWTYMHESPSKKIKDIFNNKPQLTGFLYNSEEVMFEPIHMVGVQGANLLDNTHKASDLYDLYLMWSRFYPENTNTSDGSLSSDKT